MRWKDMSKRKLDTIQSPDPTVGTRVKIIYFYYILKILKFLIPNSTGKFLITPLKYPRVHPIGIYYPLFFSHHQSRSKYEYLSDI